MAYTAITPSQVTAWVERYFDYKTRKSGDELRICNPFDDDTKYHLNISVTKQRVHDWRGDDTWCPRRKADNKFPNRSFIYFVQLYLKKIKGSCSYIEAIKDVAGSSSASILAEARRQSKERTQEKPAVSHLELPPGCLALPNDTMAGKAIYMWLTTTRKLSHDIIVDYKMMHSGLDIVWPYFEFDELVYWQMRSRISKRFLFPDESVGVTKGQFLYGFDNVEPATNVIITEAIIDSQSVGRQCVATGGAVMTPTQANKIKLLGPRDGVILAPDNDDAGISSIIANAQVLKSIGMSNIYYCVPPVELGKDWNDCLWKMSSDEISDFIYSTCKPYNVVNIKQTQQQFKKPLNTFNNSYLEDGSITFRM